LAKRYFYLFILDKPIMKQNFMKVALVGAVAVIAGFAACSGDDDPNGKNVNQTPNADSIACVAKNHPDTTYTWNSATKKCDAAYTASSTSEDFVVPATDISAPAADGISGIITNTGGGNYKVRSMGGTWWMIQNADKDVSDGCTSPSIDRGEYGRMYSENCAQNACPTGWSLPTGEDFRALGAWLTANNKWREWNSGFALAGYGYEGSRVAGQDYRGYWLSTGNGNTLWNVLGGGVSFGSDITHSVESYPVRCVKK
jgi:uncharacterized protein (TIGR02145 family)